MFTIKADGYMPIKVDTLEKALFIFDNVVAKINGKVWVRVYDSNGIMECSNEEYNEYGEVSYR